MPRRLDTASRRGEHGCMSEDKKEFYNLVAYVKGQKKKVGYAYLTKGGNLAIRSDEMMDAAQLGRLLKKGGLYIERPKVQEQRPIIALSPPVKETFRVVVRQQ